jgi:hypothetical protein
VRHGQPPARSGGEDVTPARAGRRFFARNLHAAAARAKAREFLDSYPAGGYMSKVESWRELPGDRIEFTMRRLRSAD